MLGACRLSLELDCPANLPALRPPTPKDTHRPWTHRHLAADAAEMTGRSVKVSFGEAVRHTRLAQGLSQEELADRSGLDRSYIGGVERGERNPSVVAISQIAAGLGISMAALFAEITGEQP